MQTRCVCGKHLNGHNEDVCIKLFTEEACIAMMNSAREGHPAPDDTGWEFWLCPECGRLRIEDWLCEGIYFAEFVQDLDSCSQKLQDCPHSWEVHFILYDEDTCYDACYTQELPAQHYEMWRCPECRRLRFKGWPGKGLLEFVKAF